jgi:HD-like signal output (HDOD) protein
MKENILFVDDEVNVLQGLQRLLRPRRDEWEMTFVTSAREAIALMSTRCFDVVVTDMRMPEMDGADLLEAVKKICPCSVRIILSGQAEIDTIIKSVGSAHQYLSKPCDPELLQVTINKASKLRKIMGNAELAQFISQLQSIPSQRDIYDSVEAEVNSESPSIENIANAVSKDIGMSAKVLQLTNSSFFGKKREVLSAREAVRIIGLDIFKRLFSSKRVFTRCETSAIGALELKELHERGISVGNFALRVATLEGISGASSEMYSNSGLLCRIGCIALSSFACEVYDEVMDLKEECQASIELERRLFGTSHSEIGGYLLGLWGLPDQIVNAASRHHECDCAEDKDFSILSALQIAENIASSTKYETGADLEKFDQHRIYRAKYANLMKQ